MTWANFTVKLFDVILNRVAKLDTFAKAMYKNHHIKMAKSKNLSHISIQISYSTSALPILNGSHLRRQIAKMDDSQKYSKYVHLASIAMVKISRWMF